ncbi:transposase [Streptomyces verrucosisporus]|uniref:IS701 family transposase n=1 Tax=Streptomyces verrucosisporus TaxID=1695161 RepID=UPI0019CFEBCF|nr:transposase [Streptomyces verrucosisporus]MBN3932080.1 transposase [Streptomyces verrucosisporus]
MVTAADADTRLAETVRSTRTSTRFDPHSGAFADLCSVLFASLPRSDQHRKGMLYLRGLLETPGRKSIRNIAALFGDQTSEQNLHHFICNSTWDWVPIRRALADHLVDVSRPQAWVVQPMIIPKAGRHSVGVERCFFPTLGQVLNAQRAIGVWAASERMSSPVNWRLHLPGAWLKDDLRRSRVSIPDGMGVETLSECVAEACLESTRWGLPVRPVVLDVGGMHTAEAFVRLNTDRVPLLARIGGDLRLNVTDPALQGCGTGSLAARLIMGLARNLRRPAAGRENGGRTTLAAVVRVRLPHPPGTRAGTAGGAPDTEELLLMGIGEDGGRWPAELWLTNMATMPPASLVRLSRLAGRTEQDFNDIADRVGLRDFTGRSFDGWHRHVTLASAAHAAIVLARHPH